MATITVSMLREKGACEQQVKLFTELFGESVKVTEELCIRYSDRFDFNWAARVFLSAAAWAEYQRVTAAALAEYERVEDPAWAEYKRVTAAALAEYRRVRAAAWAEYQRVRAQTWARYYNADTLSAKGE